MPVNPARDWWEAVQSVWMMHVLITCELSASVHCFGRYDQYMYPYYKKSVLDDKTMTHDEALELLECFWIHTNCTGLRSWDSVKILTGMGLGNNLTIGGQTREGKDACNDVTILCLECDEELGILLPETGMRIWSGTPDKYLRKAVELVRLGRANRNFSAIRKACNCWPRAIQNCPSKTGANIRCWAAPRPTCRISPWATCSRASTSLPKSWNW